MSARGIARIAAATATGVALGLGSLGAAGVSAAGAVEDPYFGEALYYAHQHDYFGALERLDSELAQHRGVDEPQRDPLYPYVERAEFSVGDFELSYRMHHRAGRAIRAVLEADVDEAVRNRAAYRLARIHFQKGQPEDALRALESLRGDVPAPLRDDVEFLRANVQLALGRPAEAVDVLRGLQRSDALTGFAAYNLGIALLEDGRSEEAAAQLARAGQVAARDAAAHAIRDKSNLVLGTLLLEAEQFGPAQRALDRVRLEGAFSNRALLRAGWAEASAENFERALVPWSLLAQRHATDAAVQEALLALPYAYSKLAVHGRAARLYGRAVQTFGDELGKVDASIRSIRSGAFLKALVREEIRRDEDWVIRLRSLPDAPETYYLIELMASHDFQTALQNYLDLEDLRRKLVAWRTSFAAFEDLVALRRAYYEPRLPEIDRQFRKLDARMRLRLEQRKQVDRRLRQMLVAARPELLASADEQALAARIERLASALEGAHGPEAELRRRRLERLRGALRWQLETHYHERLTRLHEHLHALNADVAALTERYDAFVRARQAAAHGHVGYQHPIDGLRARVRGARERVQVLMARQGHLLESVAIDELLARRARLEAQQNQARFAFADSYDRAAKAQAQAP